MVCLHEAIVARSPQLSEARSDRRADRLLEATVATIAATIAPVKLSTYGPRSFPVTGPITWNNLPEYLRDTELSIDNFWRQLKTLIFLFAQ